MRAEPARGQAEPARGQQLDDRKCFYSCDTPTDRYCIGARCFWYSIRANIQIQNFDYWKRIVLQVGFRTLSASTTGSYTFTDPTFTAVIPR